MWLCNRECGAIVDDTLFSQKAVPFFFKALHTHTGVFTYSLSFCSDVDWAKLCWEFTEVTKLYELTRISKVSQRVRENWNSYISDCCFYINLSFLTEMHRFWDQVQYWCLKYKCLANNLCGYGLILFCFVISLGCFCRYLVAGTQRERENK